MKPLFDDTPIEVERLLIEGYRRMTPQEKLRRVSELGRFARRLALADVRNRHPDETEREWNLRVASRHLPAELMRKAFGWDPDEKGY